MSAIQEGMTTRSLEYPKTENLFARDPETHKLTDELRRDEFGIVKAFRLSEKIDGTNMRVVYNPAEATVEIRGRSDNAQIHGDLLRVMQDMFPVIALERQFDEYLGDQVELGTTVTLFGEGFGAGIQKGGRYSDSKEFRLFDVCYHRYHGLNSWCQWSTVEMIAAGLGVDTAPDLGWFTVEEALDFVRSEPASRVAWDDSLVMEGVIGRTEPYLYTEMGSRVMFKLKGRDL